MSALRFRIVNGCILMIFGITLISLPTLRDWWPFCVYPMFESLNLRVDAPALEFYTVTGGQETYFDFRYTWMIHWRNVFLAILKDKGWPSKTTQDFYAQALKEIQREGKFEDPTAPSPTALRVYRVYYHYPDSGDFQPVVMRRVKLLEVAAAP